MKRGFRSLKKEEKRAFCISSTKKRKKGREEKGIERELESFKKKIEKRKERTGS